MQKTKSGFTIVELLIVIVVIAILAAISIVAYTGVQTRARDSQRKNYLSQMAKVMELYYIDNNEYPLCNGGESCVSTTPLPVYAYAFTDLDLGSLIDTIDNDPKNVSTQYGYYYARGYKKNGDTSHVYTDSSSDYIIGTRLEGSAGATYTGWDNPHLNYLIGNSH